MVITVAILGIYNMVFITNETMAQDTLDVKMISKDLADWCMVTVPEKARIGEDVEVKVSLKNVVKTPTKLRCDLHFKGGNSSGYWIGTDTQDVKADGTYTFKLTLIPKEGVIEAVLAIYLSPDGNWNNKTLSIIGDGFPVFK